MVLSKLEANRLAEKLGLNVSRDDFQNFTQELATESDGVSAFWDGNTYTVADGSKTIVTEYLDDEHSQISTITEKQDNNTIFTQITESGKTVTTTVGSGDNIISTHVKNYDKEGILTHTIEKKGTMTRFIVDNKVIKSEEKISDGIVTTNYEYNNEGDLLKEITNKPDGTEIIREDYKITTIKPDKTKIIEENGKKTTYKPDGSSVIEHGNTKTEILVSGRQIITVIGDNGYKKVTVKDGNKTVDLKYDSRGNILSNAKMGESFEQTAKRLGIKQNSPEYKKFKQLNNAASKRGWFTVGSEVKVPAGMEGKIKIDNLNIDVKYEKQKFEQTALQNTDIMLVANI